MILIALHGKARSGKDTFARGLLANHGFVRMAFADPLKSAVAGLFNIPQQTAFSDDKTQVLPAWGLTLRDVLQRFGTEAMRGTFGDDFWIKRWHAEYRECIKVSNVIVTDLRFPNEAEMIRSMGGTIVHIQREDGGLAGSAAQHASEQVLPFEQGDRIVENNGSLDKLAAKARMIVNDIEAAQ